MKRVPPILAFVLLALAVATPPAEPACCYFSANDKDILQPAQKVFLTFDPTENVETFTVQPKFEGNALDFGMVIPTPARPKLDMMPRDFFQELAVFTILKTREYPESKLIPKPIPPMAPAVAGLGGGGGNDSARSALRKQEIKIVESGIVGSLEYKIIEAGRADDLFDWLKVNRYNYSGDEKTLDFYVQKKWLFTVMKIDTTQMKRSADGTYSGDVTPTRFQFPSTTFVYPLRITQLSVRDKTEALLYVAAPYKTDLPGDFTYQYQWVPMLQNARGWYDKGIFGDHDLPGRADDWIKSIETKIPELLRHGQELGFNFVSGQRPAPNQNGRIATTLEWAKKLSADDIGTLKGTTAFGESVPDPDRGFTQTDVTDPRRGAEVRRTILARLDKFRKDRPGGYLVRSAPDTDVKALKLLLGHLKEGQVLTKFRKTFTKGEMTDDLLIVPAKMGPVADSSEYTEVLPTSPP